MESERRAVVSKDGTSIAYDRSGKGDVILLVSPTSGDRSGNMTLARLLSRNFTVINYDRRGRGAGTDTTPYAVEREIDDIEALIDAAGGSAYLFGSSSGAVLALDASDRLGDKVKALFLYEPPFFNSRSALPARHWSSVRAPALIMAGEKSPDRIHHAAQALASVLPNSTYRTLEGCDASAVTSTPIDIATTIYGFLLKQQVRKR